MTSERKLRWRRRRRRETDKEGRKEGRKEEEAADGQGRRREGEDRGSYWFLLTLLTIPSNYARDQISVGTGFTHGRREGEGQVGRRDVREEWRNR